MPEPKLPMGVADYTLTELLGEGGMGAVYLARRRGEERDLAVKLLHGDLARHTRFVKRFQREAQLAGAFDHPNLVAILDAGTDPESLEHYTVYEYVAGGDLADLIEAAPLEERRALELTRAVADALSYANARSIVHRDVKPENILLTPDGVAKLADLGLAKQLDPDVTHLTRAGTVLGTPHYMAPEQAQGVEDLDGRTDQYALGLCLWTMLCAELPFDPDGDARPTTVIRRRLEQVLPDPRDRRPEISAETVALIGHMTARDREARYPNADSLLADLDHLLRGEPLVGPPPLPDNGKRPPGLGLAVAAALVLLVLVGLTLAKLLG